MTIKRQPRAGEKAAPADRGFGQEPAEPRLTGAAAGSSQNAKPDQHDTAQAAKSGKKTPVPARRSLAAIASEFSGAEDDSSDTVISFDASARRRSIARKLAAAFSVLIAGIAIYVLVHTLSALNIVDLRRAIEATGADQIAAAALLTVTSFFALTGYDALALRQLRVRVPYRTTALASFTSYAISFVLGFPLITAGTVRYWIYSQAGLAATKVASLTIITAVTFWFGMIFMIGAGLTLRPAQVSAINHFAPALNFLIGAGLLGAICCYLVWVTVRRRVVRVQGFRLALPGLSFSLCQLLLGVIDQSAAAGVLYVLLPPHTGPDFFTFVAAYAFACILGIASHAPGGIGVFEATMLKAVPGVGEEQLLASLLLFRIIYYLAPFVLALALLGAHEAFRRWKSLREAMERSDTQIDDLD